VKENEDKKLASLPSGVTVKDLAMKVLNNITCKDTPNLYVPETLHDNTLMAILSCISAADVAALQEGVKMFSQFYKYYADDPAMTGIPTKNKVMPTGGAIEMMAKLLSVRKGRGIDAVADECEVRLSTVLLCLFTTIYHICWTISKTPIILKFTNTQTYVVCRQDFFLLKPPICISGRKKSKTQIHWSISMCQPGWKQT
jgi:hypothetical protein